MTNILTTLSHTLQYTFNNIDLLKLALTHRSMGTKNNERLEFLGDALLDGIIAKALYITHDKASEGDLSRLRSSLVNGEALAKIGQEFHLGDYLYLGQGELKSGGHQRASILACTLEAIIGAIYLDSDYVTCENIVLAWFKSRMNTISLDNEYKDSKTRLQEYLQCRKMPLPLYTLVKSEGLAHEQTFTILCTVETLKLKVTSVATTRRQAEKDAAQQILEAILHDK